MTLMDSNDVDLFSFAGSSSDRPPPDGVPLDVATLFEQLALEVHAAGLERYSARAILHRLRWHHNVERGDRDFKINNKHSAPLARWFLAHHPDLADFFETRERDE